MKRYNMLLADIYPKAQVRIWRQTFEMFGSRRGPERESLDFRSLGLGESRS